MKLSDETTIEPLEKKVAPLDLRGICSLFVTGVTVVTTLRGDEPVGLTINSFTSVSLDPPLVLFCLHRNSSVRAPISETGLFTVNILAEGQDEVSRAFARLGGTRFPEVPLVTRTNNTPVLAEALAHLDCRVINEMDGGDHVIVLGEVVDAGLLRHDEHPLTFFRSELRRLGV